MKLFVCILALYIIIPVSFIHADADSPVAEIGEARLIYNEIGNQSMPFTAFEYAYRGWTELKDSIDLDDHIITVIDFSQPSTKKRFFLIDLKAKKVLYQDYVAHGKNTGELMAENFSNRPNSNQSSLGFYKTAETYHGKHGLSLRLDGLEKGINDKARQRAIVIHSAWYTTDSFIRKYGRLGRSFGCPALPAENYKPIINLIKEGTLLFIYYPDLGYLSDSDILNP